MSLRWSFAACAMLAAGAVFAQNTAQAPAAQAAAPAASSQQAPAPLTPADKPNLSYAIGFQMGDGLVERKIDVDVNAVIRGLQDGFAKLKPTVAEETMHDVLGRMQAQMYTQAKAEFDKLSNENKAKSQKFLAENKGKKGVVTLPSGLQYVVIEEGSGTKHPTPSSEVSVHYRGSLINGLEFDSSFARGQPAQFKGYRVNQSVTVVVNDLHKASDIVTAAVSAGGTGVRLSGLRLQVGDPDAALEPARTDAFEQARSKAAEYAADTGGELGEVITVSESSDRVALQSRDSYAADVASGSIPLQPGQADLTASVVVVFALQ